MSHRNERLFEACAAFARAACQLIDEQFPPERYPELVNASGEDFRFLGHFVSPWVIAARALDARFQDLNEFKLCVAIAREDSVLGKTVDNMVGTPISRRRRQAREFPMAPLYELLQKSPHFDDKLFAVGYEKKELEWFADKARFEVVAPLVGLECEEELVLDNVLKVARFSLSQLPLNPLPTTGFDFPAFALRAEFELPVTGSVAETEAFAALKIQTDIFDAIERAILALHLFKPGSLRALGLLSYASNMSSGIRFRVLPGASSMAFSHYELSSEEGAGFVQFWRKLETQRIRNHSAIQLAIRRFGYAKERSRVEDKLLDFVIAAEALLVPSAQGESTYRFTTHAALLGETNERSRQLYELARKAYQLRNKLAHGADTNDPKIRKILGTQSLGAFTDEFERELRTVIQRATGAPSSPVFDFKKLLLERLK